MHRLNYDFDLGSVNRRRRSSACACVQTKDRHLAERVSVSLIRAPTPIEPITVTNSYTDWLPNANMNIHFRPEWQLRLAATKTRTRPHLRAAQSSLELDLPTGTATRRDDRIAHGGTGGQSVPQAVEVDQLRRQPRILFLATGFASVARVPPRHERLHRQPDGDLSRIRPDTGFPLQVSGPVNTNKGKIKGFEAQVSTFFDWDWRAEVARMRSASRQTSPT